MNKPTIGVRYLDMDDLLDVIRFATESAPALRDVGLLESALHRPAASLFGEDAYVGLFLKAAALIESLIRNHGLIDGNKRSGWVAGVLFLRLNGLKLGGEPDATFALVLRIAEGRADLGEIAADLERWSEPG